MSTEESETSSTSPATSADEADSTVAAAAAADSEVNTFDEYAWDDDEDFSVLIRNLEFPAHYTDSQKERFIRKKKVKYYQSKVDPAFTPPAEFSLITFILRAEFFFSNSNYLVFPNLNLKKKVFWHQVPAH